MAKYLRDGANYARRTGTDVVLGAATHPLEFFHPIWLSQFEYWFCRNLKRFTQHRAYDSALIRLLAVHTPQRAHR